MVIFLKIHSVKKHCYRFCKYIQNLSIYCNGFNISGVEQSLHIFTGSNIRIMSCTYLAVASVQYGPIVCTNKALIYVKQSMKFNTKRLRLEHFASRSPYVPE